jgi:hypothetical protein
MLNYIQFHLYYTQLNLFFFFFVCITLVYSTILHNPKSRLYNVYYILAIKTTYLHKNLKVNLLFVLKSCTYCRFDT